MLLDTSSVNLLGNLLICKGVKAKISGGGITIAGEGTIRTGWTF